MPHGKLDMIAALWRYIRAREKWWLFPPLLILLLLGFVIIFAETSALAPLLYTVF